MPNFIFFQEKMIKNDVKKNYFYGKKSHVTRYLKTRFICFEKKIEITNKRPLKQRLTGCFNG